MQLKLRIGMCVSIHACMHTFTQTHTHNQLCIHTYILTYIHTNPYSQSAMYVIHTYIHTYRYSESACQPNFLKSENPARFLRGSDATRIQV